ncbi:MAG: hypothetical protein GWP19_11085 [Planctomycetia bacterium]|nr:hypothetical protein [Planctomycetia bacterium]
MNLREQFEKEHKNTTEIKKGILFIREGYIGLYSEWIEEHLKNKIENMSRENDFKNLHEAWNDLIIVIAKHLKIFDIVNWLESKLNEK